LIVIYEFLVVSTYQPNEFGVCLRKCLDFHQCNKVSADLSLFILTKLRSNKDTTQSIWKTRI